MSGRLETCFRTFLPLADLTMMEPPQSSIGILAPGYRLPATTRVGRVRLQVSDLERSLHFYRDLLGMRAVETGGWSGVLLDAAGDPRPLVELVEDPDCRPVRQHSRLGLYHFALLLPSRPDLGHFARRLIDQDVRFGAADHLVSEALYLTDPDGLGVEVYADRPADEWRIQDRQIEMATDRLDVDDLLRESGSGRWEGMPAGTVVGHIHLHVRDLDRAAGFYHEGLGLDKIVWTYPGALFLSAGGYHHHLGMNTWARGAPPATDEDARLIEWSLVLPHQSDIKDASASLSSHGFTVDASGRVADPWGTVLRLGEAV